MAGNTQLKFYWSPVLIIFKKIIINWKFTLNAKNLYHHHRPVFGAKCSIFGQSKKWFLLLKGVKTLPKSDTLTKDDI